MKDGGPAYPRPTTGWKDAMWDEGAAGMTLLQHYAGLAMQAIITNDRVLCKTLKYSDDSQESVAHGAFEQAQAMIEAEEKLREAE